HPCGAVASVYHAFDTCPGATGCTVLVAFDEGEARLDGWIPRRLTIACPVERVAGVAALLGGTGVPGCVQRRGQPCAAHAARWTGSAQRLLRDGARDAHVGAGAGAGAGRRHWPEDGP